MSSRTAPCGNHLAIALPLDLKYTFHSSRRNTKDGSIRPFMEEGQVIREKTCSVRQPVGISIVFCNLFPLAGAWVGCRNGDR